MVTLLQQVELQRAAMTLTQLLPLPPPPVDDLHQLICSLSHSHEARRLVDHLPPGEDEGID